MPKPCCPLDPRADDLPVELAVLSTEDLLFDSPWPDSNRLAGPSGITAVRGEAPCFVRGMPELLDERVDKGTRRLIPGDCALDGPGLSKLARGEATGLERAEDDFVGVE